MILRLMTTGEFCSSHLPLSENNTQSTNFNKYNMAVYTHTATHIYTHTQRVALIIEIFHLYWG